MASQKTLAVGSTNTTPATPPATTGATGSVPEDAITFKIERNGIVVAILPAPIRTFSSGNHGYGAYDKTMLPDGRRLQLSLNATILKPKS